MTDQYEVGKTTGIDEWLIIDKYAVEVIGKFYTQSMAKFVCDLLNACANVSKANKENKK